MVGVNFIRPVIFTDTADMELTVTACLLPALTMIVTDQRLLSLLHQNLDYHLQ